MRSVILAIVIVASSSPVAIGATYSPLLDEYDGVNANDGSYLILPALENTDANVKQKAYFVFPRYLQYARTPDGRASQIGITHRGFSLFASGSPDYAPLATFLAAIEPAQNDEMLKRIKKELTDRDVAAGLQAPVFPVPTFKKSVGQLVVAGVSDPKTHSPVDLTGGFLGQTMIANFVVPSNVHRAFVLDVSANAGRQAKLWGYILKGTIAGYGNRLDCQIRIEHKKVYDYFAARATTQSFWGLVKTDISSEMRRMDSNGAVDFGKCKGRQADIDKIVMPIWAELTKLENDDGDPMFVEMVKQTAGANHPNAGAFGWGFQASARWASVTSTRKKEYNFNIAYQTDWEFPVSMLFDSSCSTLKDYVINQTDPLKPCIAPADIELVAKAQKACANEGMAQLADWKQRGWIDEAEWKSQRQTLFRDGCGWSPSNNTSFLVRFRNRDALKIARATEKSVKAKGLKAGRRR